MESPSSMRPAGRISTAAPCPSLPVEIWQNILCLGVRDANGSFWSYFRYHDLASICRSCSSFRDLVRPYLYSNFNSHHTYVLCDYEWQRCSVAKFAWTVSTNPLLASMVQRVEIRGVCDALDMVPESLAAFHYQPIRDMAPVLTKRAVELGLVLKYQEVYTDVHTPRNVGFDLVALILAQLPMLDTLTLMWLGAPPIIRMPQQITQPRGMWPWSASIRNITLNHQALVDPTEDFRARHKRRTVHGDCLNPVLPLFCSGSTLTTLTLCRSAGPKFALPLENLREVIIIDCQFRPRQFLNLLEPCKNLNKFVTKNTNVSFGLEIIQALKPAYEGLQVLGLDLVGWNGPRILTFKKFTALKTLYVGLPCVWNQEVMEAKDFPPNPDLLLSTLLPESIEEVALFKRPLGELFGFEFEAHAKKLALERVLNGRFQRLKWLRGVYFGPIHFTWREGMAIGLVGDEPEEVREHFHHVARRYDTLAEARKLMCDEGVEFSFDYSIETPSFPVFGIDDLIWGPDN